VLRYIVTTAPRAEVPPVLVRSATPADLPAARELIERSGLPLDGLDDAAVLVAEANGRLVGTVALERHGEGPGLALLLRSAAVEPDRRSNGIGAALTAAVLEQADAARAPVALLTETAADYFPRFGFMPVARDTLPEAVAATPECRSMCPATAVAMARALAAGESAV